LIGGKYIKNYTNWIEHKGKHILYIDYSDLYDEELTNATLKVNEFFQQSEQRDLLVLVDVRNSVASEKWTVDALKKNATIAKSHTKKTAVIGVTKAQEVILTVVNMFSDLGVKPFNNIDKAKDWLIE
jgi:hypothetical protein